jgi:hypothetical protein
MNCLGLNLTANYLKFNTRVLGDAKETCLIRLDCQYSTGLWGVLSSGFKLAIVDLIIALSFAFNSFEQCDTHISL